MRHAGARRAEARDLVRAQMDAVREPDVVAQPAEVLEVLHGAHAEALEAEDLLVERLGQVGVQAHAAAPRELRRLGHQLGRDRERRARRQRDAHHRPRRRVVEAVDGRLAGREDRVAVLDDRVGRQAAGGLPEVHRPAARVEAHAEAARRLDLDLEQVAGAGREDVVVVGRGRAARARERGQPGAGGRPLDLGVDVRPHRIELDEPLEQRRLLGEAARGPLVEVVVAVDEPRRGQAAAAVDARDVAVLARARAPRRPRRCGRPR